VKDVADLVRKPRNMDVDQFALARMTEDHKEGEAFLGRRKPRFRGK
jgi:enoyl-CoA hydratase